MPEMYDEVFRQSIILDVDGVARFKSNSVVRFLLDASEDGRKIDLSTLWLSYYAGAFTIEDMEQFYQLIGYSVEEFCEISAIRDSTKEAMLKVIQGLPKKTHA